mgnify:CR=1 FL=1
MQSIFSIRILEFYSIIRFLEFLMKAKGKTLLDVPMDLLLRPKILLLLSLLVFLKVIVLNFHHIYLNKRKKLSKKFILEMYVKF